MEIRTFVILLFLAIFAGCSSSSSSPTADKSFSWSNPLPQGNHLYGVWGNSSSDFFAVGGAGSVVHYNGTKWSIMNSGTNINLCAVWGTSSQNVYAVGDQGKVLHYDGAKWNLFYQYSETDTILRSIWGTSATDIFVGGAGGDILHYDGSEWTLMESGSESLIGHVGDIRQCTLCGKCKYQRLQRYDLFL